MNIKVWRREKCTVSAGTSQTASGLSLTHEMNCPVTPTWTKRFVQTATLNQTAAHLLCWAPGSRSCHGLEKQHSVSGSAFFSQQHIQQYIFQTEEFPQIYKMPQLCQFQMLLFVLSLLLLSEPLTPLSTSWHIQGLQGYPNAWKQTTTSIWEENADSVQQRFKNLRNFK